MYIVLVLEYCGGHTLYELSSPPLSEERIKGYFRQAVAGAKALHDSGMAHMDLKLKNIMVDERDQVKIIDFNTAVLTDTEVYIDVGIGDWRAPERFLPGNKSPKMLDVWTLGVGLFELLFGRKPFGPLDSDEEVARLMRFQFDFGDRQVSQEVKDLIRHIFVPAEQRLTLEQIQQHPWIKGE